MTAQPSSTRPGPARPPGWPARLTGTAVLPDTRDHRGLILALSVDTLGVGLFLPLAFFFFTVTTDLPVVGIGSTITAATLTALALSPLGGVVTDRWGARRAVVMSNALTAVGYLCYPLATSYAAVFGCVFVVMVADRLYFAGWPTLIASISRRGQLDSWYALIQAVSAGSVGVGALVSTLFLAQGGAGVLKVIVVLNALTSLIAAVVTARVPLTAPAREPDRHVRFGQVLRDRPFRRLLTAQLLIATAWTLPAAFLPLYLVRVLAQAEWWITFVFVINYLLLFIAQLSVTQHMRALRRTRVVLCGCCLLLVSLALVSGGSAFAGWPAVALVVGGVVVYSFGEMFISPSSYALVAAMAPPELRGSYMSLYQITGMVAFGIGPGLVGWLFALAPLSVPMVVGCCVLAGSAVLLLSEHMFAPDVQRGDPSAEPALAANAERRRSPG